MLFGLFDEAGQVVKSASDTRNGTSMRPPDRARVARVWLTAHGRGRGPSEVTETPLHLWFLLHVPLLDWNGGMWPRAAENRVRMVTSIERGR